MNTLIQIIFAAITGTSLMTLFSYFLANATGKQFREPVLLSKLIQPSKGEEVPKVAGWLLHYGVGIIFVISYHFVWFLEIIDTTLLSGSILGFFSGLVAVAGWWGMFYLYPNPPSIDFKWYYVQLIVAHIIFGIGATAGYLLTQYFMD